MTQCKRCGSQAINHKHHGRDGTKPDLCDVCYWREKYEDLLVQSRVQMIEIADLKRHIAADHETLQVRSLNLDARCRALDARIDAQLARIKADKAGVP